ncbi:MAG: hypothetical protein AAF587_44255 [Bacteroidota bacterium]
MNPKKATNKLLYFFRELTIVVIGIFIAFQLNNYNENKKIKDAEIRSLHRLLSDLETEKRFLKQYKHTFQKKRQKLKAIVYDRDRSNLDSLHFYLAHEYVHYDFNTEYSTLKFGGDLSLISNDTLRYNLVKYYEQGYAYSKEISENHKNYVEDHLLITLDDIPIDTARLFDPLLIEKKLNDQKFIETIKTQITWYGANLRAIKLNRVESLLKAVKKELETNANKYPHR